GKSWRTRTDCDYGIEPDVAHPAAEMSIFGSADPVPPHRHNGRRRQAHRADRVARHVRRPELGKASPSGRPGLRLSVEQFRRHHRGKALAARLLPATDRQVVQIASQLRSMSAWVVAAEITDSRITQRSCQRAPPAKQMPTAWRRAIVS